MSTKDIRKFATLLIGATTLIAFGLFPARLSAQGLLTLTGGTTTNVGQTDAVCVTYLTIRSDADAQSAIKDHGCTGNRLFTWLATGESLLFDKVDLTASAQFVVQFQVKAVQGAATTSFVPILIAVPVDWRGLLDNDSLIPPVGALDSVGAHVDVNMFLRLSQGTPGFPDRPTVAVTENRFNGITHAGIGGCLSIPTSGLAALSLAYNCALGVALVNAGTGTVYLTSIVETGKTYNIELELRSDLFSLNASFVHGVGGHPEGNFETNQFNDKPFGLTWNGPMSITVGTDFQGNLQALQNEITQLRQEFKTHRHVYLTGKGVGQNNTPANTSTPVFPMFPLFP